MTPLTEQELQSTGIDSNCLSFIVDALDGIETPADGIAAQKIALARIFFYGGQTLFTTPTVRAECDRISNAVRREKHHSWMMTHFGTLPVRVPQHALKARALVLQQFHPKERDCMILAEAEALQLAILLSFDFDFVERLKGKTTIKLMKPLDSWQLMGTPKGATPKTIPTSDNLLAAQQWWRVENP